MIPETLDSNFLLELYKQLIDIFKDNTLEEIVDYCGGTVGFARAFETVCKNQDRVELLSYWKSLDWVEGDCFDDEVLQMLSERLG